MRTLAATLASLALLGAVTARGEEVGVWTDPLGRFTLSFPGFDVVTPPRGTGVVLDIERQGSNAATRTIRSCSVFAPELEPGGLTQAEINTGMAVLTEAAAPLNWTGLPDFRFSHGAVDGVAVIEMRFHTDRFYQHWLIFRLPGDGHTEKHELGCGGSLPISAQEEAELDAVLASLRFTGAARP